MKICITNALSQSARIIGRTKDGHRGGYAFFLTELSRHLQELARRHRQNDPKAIEEFIELYGLEPSTESCPSLNTSTKGKP